MKSTRTLLLLLFVISNLSLIAQTTNELQCQMTVEEIQFSQTWDIDDALSENTQNIAISLFAELNQIYELVNQNSTTGMDAHILSIQNSILAANAIGMNYAMFEDDLEFIETLN